jgi:hypothetical protein
MSTTKKIQKTKIRDRTFLYWEEFSRRLSVSNTWGSVSHSQDLRDGNGNSTSPYYPLWCTGKIFAPCTLDLVLCCFRGLRFLLFCFLSFFLAILGIEFKASATKTRLLVLIFCLFSEKVCSHFSDHLWSSSSWVTMTTGMCHHAQLGFACFCFVLFFLNWGLNSELYPC